MDENFVLNRIEELCQKKGISHYKLALLSGVNQSSLSTLMNRKSTPNVYTLAKICKGLGVTLAQFFSQEDSFANLTEEQRILVSTWTDMNDVERNMVLAYMQGLVDAKKVKDM